MASPLPDEGSCTYWHLCWRAAVGREIFADPALYVRVRHRLLEAHRRRERALVDYLLLPGEIHVISRLQADDSPEKLARAIGNIVSRWVQETSPVRSPVFAGPYRAVAIHDKDALVHECRMLAWRPVVLGLCRTTVHYSRSALRTTLGLRPGQGYDSRPLLCLLGDGVREARDELRERLLKRPSERETRQWELLCGLALAIGSEGSGFVSHSVKDAGTAKLIAAGGRDGITGALRLLEIWVAARLGGGRPIDLRRGHDAISARGRALVACLARAHDLCSAASVARHFGRAKATLSEQMTQCRKRPADQAILARPLQEIVDEALRLSSPPSGGRGMALVRKASDSMARTQTVRRSDP